MIKLPKIEDVFSPKFYIPLSLLIILSILPLLVSNLYVQHVMIMIFIFGFLSTSWNLIAGFCGQFSLMHASLAGLGAYTSTLLLLNFNLTPWLGMFVGAAFSVAIAIFVGYFSFRLMRGPYFVLCTLAVGDVIRLVTLHWIDVTRGPLGLLVDVLPTCSLYYFQFKEKIFYYYITFFLVLLAIYVVTRIEKSKMGFFFRAIRYEQDAAETLGVNTFRYKLIALVISAALAAIGGTVYAQYILYIHPNVNMSLGFGFKLILYVVIGGAGTTLGPIVGCFVLIPISELILTLLSQYPGVNLVVYAVMLIVALRYAPTGVLGFLKRIYSWIDKIAPRKGVKHA